ncbi:MAG: transcription-repair coupling factor [Bacteroidota bacterium]
MQVADFIALYKQNGWVKVLAQKFRVPSSQCFQLKGTTGSLPAVLAAAVRELTTSTQLFVLHDREDAAYFYSDLQNLLPQKKVLLYPAAHQQPYEVASVASADILMRTEVLYQLSKPDQPNRLIVTYPEALPTKVIVQASLARSTLTIEVGEKLMMTDLVTKLSEQGFEKTGFVYEAGQWAIRGGIIDIFSYAYQLPYRIELLGQEVESIRTFDPANQCSLERVQDAAIVPYIQASSMPTAYQSFLDFLPTNTLIWIKDYASILSTIEQRYQQAITVFQTLEGQQAAEKTPQQPPEALYETPASWEEALQRFSLIEFGTRFYLKPNEVLTYPTSAQPAFNQQFALLAENLHQNQEKGLTNILTAESSSQFERLTSIFIELDASVHFQPLYLGLSQGYIDHQVGVACYTDHQLFGRYYRYKNPQKYSRTQAITLREAQTLQLGDYVVHIDYGIARFAGLSKVVVNGKEQEVLRLVYKDNDLVCVSLHALHKISRYAGKEGAIPTVSKLGTAAWEQKKKKVKRRVQDIAKELIQLYSQRKHAPGFAFSQDGVLQAELESSFIYEDTPDQAAATADVKKDMEAPYPMDRLVCGDVGFGKTEVAIRAACKAVNDGKQVAVLVPTTILALQHYESFKSRLASFPIQIHYINRFKPSQEIKQVLQAAAQGQIDILIGTHRILNKAVKFKDLGLLIIDEEQKFGVKAKERLKEFKVHVDVLTLTATPIPRTLHFSLMGARDLSIIATPPPNRQPVETTIHSFDKTLIQEAIHYEVQRGGQVFFVHNRIADIEEVANMVHKLVPEYRIGVAHGQMAGTQLEQRMLQFITGGYDILVSTNIIESGLDIPNANTIIINSSHMFGLSDLHQMRGRVGRSNKKAFCYLLAPPTASLTVEARKRLSALKEFSDLGDGFKVAMRDLDIRGAGDLLGAEQSGFIADVGFEAYCKILDEAVQELKTGEFKELFAEELAKKSQAPIADCIIETDLELLIPDTYVSNTSERLRLYTRLDSIEGPAALAGFQKELKDRFGPLPLSVQELIKVVKLRWTAKQLMLQKIKIKTGTMRCYFAVEQQHKVASSLLSHVIAYIQQRPQRCQLKEIKSQLILIINQVASVDHAQEALEDMIPSTSR